MRIFCSSLTSVTIGNNVTTIGESAFNRCTGLTSVEIPDSVTYIGGMAFSSCSSLTSVTIPNSVTSIGFAAFEGCSRLTTVNYKGTQEQWEQISKKYGNEALTNATINYYSFKVTSDNVSDTISNLTEGGSYTIIVTGAITNDTISAINTALTTLQTNNTGAKVNLDLSHIENLTELPDKAFQNCGSLTSVTIPDSVTSIGYGAFYDCSSLESVMIPDSVTSIGDSAFDGCDSLTSVVIGDSVTFIGDRTFSGCSSLTTVNYKGSQEQWGQISIGNSNSYLTNATINYNYSGE